MTKYGMASDQKSSTIDVSSSNHGGSEGNHGGSEGMVLPITGHKLNGQNFLQWSKSVMMFICGKGKDDHLTGDGTPSKKEDPKFKAWKSENSMVMSWLINSMNDEIGENFMFYGTAKEIWDAARETYSDNDNTAELFEIKSVLHDLRQGDMSVAQYFNTLNRHWQQLDMFEEVDWDCPADSIKYKKTIEKERIFKFLLGLNKDLDEVRGTVLETKPLPSIREVFSEVRREESRKKIMMGSQGISTTTENSALVSRKQNFSSNDNRARKGRPWCDHCRKPGHTKEVCWKLHGKPADWKPNKPQVERDSHGLMILGDENPMPKTTAFSKEQLDILRKMLGDQSQSTPATATVGMGSIAQKGFGLGEDDWQC